MIQIDSFKSANDLIKEFKKEFQEVSEGSIKGIFSGFEKLDDLTSGFQPDDLIIIAGRPSIGKSSFVLSMIRNIAFDFGKSVALFSPEMSSKQIIERLICFETGLSLSKLRRGSLQKHEWELFSVKSKKIEQASIYVDDSYNLTIQSLSELARIYVREKGVNIIMIDNIHQLMSVNQGKGNITREQELSEITRGLKSLAKELHIPIVAVSQLSREVENRSSKRPILSDLRGSGTIEEIADIVSFIYRPEYYNIEEWDDDEQMPTFGQGDLMIAKNRHGDLKNIRFKFTQNIGKFDNLQEYSDLYPKMNHEDNPFITKNLPSANEAFGSNLNDDDDDSDVPF
ncbi:replicative DNA helicase [Flavobacterium johnsoniae]|uniref:replicative DNA helicase n=1 Tax=Flavobacterium johnsoniae TaxID=986 RepID=UPI0011ED6033|nr:DnaB-like helicase C-terminal domain-containing protein [Flavobacterium johnsoniae]